MRSLVSGSSVIESMSMAEFCLLLVLLSRPLWDCALRFLVRWLELALGALAILSSVSLSVGGVMVSGVLFGFSSWLLFPSFCEFAKSRCPVCLIAASSFLVGSLSFPFFLYALAGQSGCPAGAGP